MTAGSDPKGSPVTVIVKKTIVLGEHKTKLKFVNIILSTNKLIIYSKRNNTANSNIKQSRYSMNDLFPIEKYWAATNDESPVVLEHGTQSMQN